MSLIATYPYAVPSYLCDAHQRLKPHAILHYFEDAAWRNAEELGFGHSQFYSLGRMWVLSRVRIEILRHPRWQEELQLQTWPAGTEKLFALRDFKVYAGSGELCVQAVTQWLLLDAERGRPIPPSRVFDDAFFDQAPDERACARSPERLLPPEDAASAGSLTACYSSIDVNDHVNNAEFVRWGFDAVCNSIEKPPELIEIDFKSAVRSGERLSIERQAAGGAGDGDSCSVTAAVYASDRGDESEGAAEADSAEAGAPTPASDFDGQARAGRQGELVSVVRFTC